MKEKVIFTYKIQAVFFLSVLFSTTNNKQKIHATMTKYIQVITFTDSKWRTVKFQVDYRSSLLTYLIFNWFSFDSLDDYLTKIIEKISRDKSNRYRTTIMEELFRRFPQAWPFLVRFTNLVYSISFELTARLFYIFCLLYGYFTYASSNDIFAYSVWLSSYLRFLSQVQICALDTSTLLDGLLFFHMLFGYFLSSSSHQQKRKER